MIVVREAGTEDGPSLVRLFAAAPVRAGTDFILDRGPDFFGLLRARGQFRTFIAEEDGRLAGSATALWHDARESGASERVGEIVDVRAAEWARGGRAVIPLLNAVSDAFRAAHVDWAVCLIADRNRAAASLVRGAWGFPIFEALHRWASVHYMAVRAPLAGIRRVRIREAVPSDASILGELSATTTGSWRLAPPELFAWPDPAARHRAWIAEDYSGRAIAGLVIWDASDFRRVQIAKYALRDLPMRMALTVAAPLGAAVPLPAPGGVLSMWAARWIGAVRGSETAVGGLVHAGLRAAVRAGIHVVQINVPAGDAVLTSLPSLPRSTFWSTLFGLRLSAQASPAEGQTFYADLARV